MAGAGRRAFVRALRDVFGWEDEIEYICFSGATDLSVLDQIARRRRYSLSSEETTEFFDALTAHFRGALHDAPAMVFPGVPRLLQALADDGRFLLGLVTGNVESCARLKLAHFGLHGLFLSAPSATNMRIATISRDWPSNAPWTMWVLARKSEVGS